MKSHHHIKKGLCLEMEMFNASDYAPSSEIEKCESGLQSAARILAVCGFDLKCTYKLMCYRLGS